MSSPSYILLFLSQCLVQLHRQLERNILLRLVHAVDLLQQGQLEGLRDLFFGSPALPVRRKPGGSGAPLSISHRVTSAGIILNSVYHTSRRVGRGSLSSFDLSSSLI